MRRSGKLTLKRNTYTGQLVTERMIETHPTIVECQVEYCYLVIITFAATFVREQTALCTEYRVSLELETSVVVRDAKP